MAADTPPKAGCRHSTARPNFIRDEEGVPETVGFILILAIILLAISTVYAVAIPMMAASEDNQYVRNVENSFEILAHNVNRIVMGSAPSQSVEVKLKGAELAIRQASNFNFSWLNQTRSQVTLSLTLLTVEHEHPLQSGRKIAYEGGGVWTRQAEGRGAVLRPPPFSLHRNTTVLPLAAATASNDSIGGTAVARVELWDSCRQLGTCAATYTEEVNATNITLRISSKYCYAWKDYFDNELDFQSSHYEDSDCADDQLNVSITRYLDALNTTLYIVRSSLNGRVY